MKSVPMAGLYDDFAELGSSSIGFGAANEVSAEQAHAAQHKATLINEASIQTIRILERNMSALYTTARLEVKRKDEEILRLRKLLERERRSLHSVQSALEAYLCALQQRCQAVLDAAQAASPVAPSALQGAVESFKSLADAPFSATGWADPSNAGSLAGPARQGARAGGRQEGPQHVGQGGRDRSRSRERSGAAGGDRGSGGYGPRAGGGAGSGHGQPGQGQGQGRAGGYGQVARGGESTGGGQTYGYQQDSRYSSQPSASAQGAGYPYERHHGGRGGGGQGYKGGYR